VSPASALKEKLFLLRKLATALALTSTSVDIDQSCAAAVLK
jgi:hypothetical protein